MARLAARSTLVALLLATGAFAQGVPTIDPRMAIEREAILEQGERDLALQGERVSLQEALDEIEREQLGALEGILDATTAMGGDGAAGIIDDLETGPATESGADILYAPDDPNPATGQLFGDASGNIEQLIIDVAKETHGLPGVGRAGLSVVQWRCLLQALIWQESRFTINARSPAAAYGLTQIIPGTARLLGIYPAYYESPYLQVEGGARYLATQLATFDGNIIHALAAYKRRSGPRDRVRRRPPVRGDPELRRRHTQALQRLSGAHGRHRRAGHHRRPASWPTPR